MKVIFIFLIFTLFSGHAAGGTITILGKPADNAKSITECLVNDGGALLVDAYEGEASRGKISGITLYEIKGFNDTLSSALELISDLSTLEVSPLTSALTVEISSSSATDDNASTGAKTVEITYIDSAGALLSELVATDGQVPVVSTDSMETILFARVVDVGASGQVGDIYVYNGTDSSGVPDNTATTYAKIPAGQGSASNGKFKVPAGKTALIVDVDIYTSGTGPYVVHLYNQKSGEAKNVIQSWAVKDGHVRSVLNHALEAEEYIYFAASSENAGDDIAIRARVTVFD